MLDILSSSSDEISYTVLRFASASSQLWNVEIAASKVSTEFDEVQLEDVCFVVLGALTSNSKHRD